MPVAVAATAVTSAAVVVVQTGSQSLGLSFTPASIGPLGGMITFTVTAQNIPDGTTVYLLLNGAYTGQSAVLAGGGCTITYTVAAAPALTTTSGLSFTVSLSHP